MNLLRQIWKKKRIVDWYLYKFCIHYIPFLRPVYKTQTNQSPIKISMWFMQKLLGFNRDAYWPVHFTSTINGCKNIYVGIDAAPGYSPNCYIQAVGSIYIGDYTQIAPNVGIISSNHFLFDVRKHVYNSVKIGRYCSIGFGSVILPGVELGDFTYVGAGTVVTKPFPEGYCVLKGNPAEIVMKFDDEQKKNFLEWKNEYEYNGYIPHHKFEKFRKENLNI